MRGALPWRLVELELAAHEEGWQAYHEIASASAFLGGFALFLLYYRSNAADFSQPCLSASFDFASYCVSRTKSHAGTAPPATNAQPPASQRARKGAAGRPAAS